MAKESTECVGKAARLWARKASVELAATGPTRTKSRLVRAAPGRAWQVGAGLPSVHLGREP
eukprot:8791569-Alexandrium_andersonii.AAC.1